MDTFFYSLDKILSVLGTCLHSPILGMLALVTRHPRTCKSPEIHKALGGVYTSTEHCCGETLELAANTV